MQQTKQLIGFGLMVLAPILSSCDSDNGSTERHDIQESRTAEPDVRIFELPAHISGLPIWSTSTAVNRMECNQELADRSGGWVVKQWKNQESLCNDGPQVGEGRCADADSEHRTGTSAFCYWGKQRTAVLELDARSMPDFGCRPNLRGNVGGYVGYLAWEPRLIAEFKLKPERFMLRNIDRIDVSYGFATEHADTSFDCPEDLRDPVRKQRSAVISSLSTAIFTEIDPQTKQGTGRTIFYQIMNFDSRPAVQKDARAQAHGFVTCNYKSNQFTTMIYRDTVTEFGFEFALPDASPEQAPVRRYELSLLPGVQTGLGRCYDDFDINNFMLTGFHVGDEIINGARHRMRIIDPKLRITYKARPAQRDGG